MDATRLFDLPLCVIDVETTGSSIAYGDRITELGVVRIEQGKVVATYQQLLNPGRPVSPGAAAITGITNDMLVDQPTFCDVWPAVRQMLAGTVLIGHNVHFDIGFFDGECRKLGNPLRGEVGEYALLDTLKIANKQFGRGGNGLQKLAARLEAPTSTAHRALADCLTTFAVFEKMLAFRGGWNLTLDQVLAMQGGASKPPADPVRKQIVSDEVAVSLVAGQKVCITYLDAAQQRSQRTVTPMYVRRIRGTQTLFAHCHLRNEQRTFKLERILAVVPAVEETLDAPWPDDLYNAFYAETESE
ncbi:MAG: polymerase epsilon subunit [Phycisphaerales bacterium]|nr:polymerase epsilon subunit [Phycisphaerales bacterium]